MPQDDLLQFLLMSLDAPLAGLNQRLKSQWISVRVVCRAVLVRLEIVAR